MKKKEYNIHACILMHFFSGYILGGKTMNKISQANLLNAVFHNVYGTKFRPDCIDDRVKLQKAVFIMRERGISCGDYEFVWDQYGPFSAELSDDMKMEVDASELSVKFNQEATDIMACLKRAFARETTYSVRYWAEAIASLLYLKQYVYPSYTDEDIIQVLERKKKDLNNHNENEKAMKVLQEILAA
jgi:uncharacterized protein YwgA